MLEAFPERAACRRMVGLLALAHDRGCEAALAEYLEHLLAAHRLPDLAEVTERVLPDLWRDNQDESAPG